MAGRRAATILVLAVATLLHCAAAQTQHVVGDGMGWTLPPGGSIAYSIWASTKTFSVGDTLVFNFLNGSHDASKVTKAAFDACNTTNPISRLTNSPATFTLDSAGEHYFLCTVPQHCEIGQKLAINVTSAPSSSGPSASPASSPSKTPSPASTPEAAGRPTTTYVVGDQLGWTVPPGGSIAYAIWAFNKTIFVGDTLVFNFTNGFHNVAEVRKQAYNGCNTNNPISLESKSPARITLKSEGEHFFLCTFSQHCPLGQKLAINVSAASGSTATPPSSTATPPSSIATPPSSIATPPISIATPPSSIATPPSSFATPPSSTATPPSSIATPPSITTTPTASGPTPPPPASSSPPTLAVAGFSVIVLSIAVASLF